VSGFDADDAGIATARFAPQEVSILTDLVSQLVSLVEDRGDPGSDPALDRLLPAGYRDSAEDATEFRRFTEEDLAAGKVHNAQVVLETLGRFSHGGDAAQLDAAEIQAWLRTLTDLRLTLAARLQVDRDGTLPDGSDEMTVAVYEWLGYLQESLLDAIDR
jgi:hypothetical protein